MLFKNLLPCANCTPLFLYYYIIVILFLLYYAIKFQVPEVITSPDDEMAIPGQEKTFSCIFKGYFLPIWIITKTEGDPVTVASGMTTSFFNYPAITAIVGDGSEGTVSTLEVTTDLSLNGSTYKCHISTVPPSESHSATLTVFGRYC